MSVHDETEAHDGERGVTEHHSTVSAPSTHDQTPDLEKQAAPTTTTPPPTTHTFPEGSLWGWLTLVGGWLAIFVTFGYANAFGVFQAYYTVKYPNQTASNISWVGSVQLFLQFVLGAVVGPLYDRGYFYYLVISGSVIYVVCFFMMSLAKEFWQTVLAQAIGMGIGVGLIYLPVLSVISHYFHRRRAFAIGVVVTGSSVGGICLPIMLNRLIASYGFEKAVQYTGYLSLGCLVLACCLMRTRLGPNPEAGPKLNPKELFSSVPYTIAVAGLFFVSWGVFFPPYYLQIFAEDHDIPDNLTDYTLAILNAASVLGRITPNFLADYVGPLNLLTFMCTCAGFICFSIFGATTSGGLIVVTILFGFFSGAFVSLMSPALMIFARNFHEIGARVGMGMMAMAFAALSGTPIAGALLDQYGFKAPIIWSGVSVLFGSALFVVVTIMQRRAKGTWKV